MEIIRILPALAALAINLSAAAQTDCSLFFKKDKVQLPSASSEQGASYKALGHHGPAVENLQMALRLYFNDSGAIDVYNKRKDGLELAPYGWYPTEAQQAAEGAGSDEYYVGKTVGLGGVALRDGSETIRPVATQGRIAKAGRTRRGCFAEITSRGVMLSDGPVDLTLRIDVRDGSRWARVSASASRKVRFVTGINHPQICTRTASKGLLGVWGVHPADVAKDPKPIGAALSYKPRMFGTPEEHPGMSAIVSAPRRRISTLVFSASSAQVLASEGNASATDWENYLKKMLPAAF